MPPPPPSNPVVRIFDDPGAVAQAGARRVAELAAASITARGSFVLALSGGLTPRAMYQHLAAVGQSGPRGPVDWPRTHVWWGDERCVPSNHPESNARMARESLLSRVPIPPAHVHEVNTALSPDAAAADYDRRLRAFFGPAAAFDLVLLGLGADGHTLSLFPGSPVLKDRSRWAAAAQAPQSAAVRDRVTLTLRCVADASSALFLVTGRDKAPALRDALAGADLPAAHVRVKGVVEWIVDRDAASPLP